MLLGTLFIVLGGRLPTNARFTLLDLSSSATSFLLTLIDFPRTARGTSGFSTGVFFGFLDVERGFDFASFTTLGVEVARDKALAFEEDGAVGGTDVG